MARALARGWGDPVLCSDAGSGRAAALAAELGGRAASNSRWPSEADLVVLCHKPDQLRRGGRRDRRARQGASPRCSAARTVGRSRRPTSAPVFRLMPNTPVEVRRGVIVCYAR